MRLNEFNQQLRRSERKVAYLTGFNVTILVCTLCLSFSKPMHQGIALATILCFAFFMYILFRKQHRKQREREDRILESYGEREICFRKSSNSIVAQYDIYLWFYGACFLVVFSALAIMIYQELHHSIILSILLVGTHLLSVGFSFLLLRKVKPSYLLFFDEGFVIGQSRYIAYRQIEKAQFVELHSGKAVLDMNTGTVFVRVYLRDEELTQLNLFDAITIV